MNTITAADVFEYEHNARVLSALLAFVEKLTELQPGTDLARTVKLARQIADQLADDLDTLSEDASEAEANQQREAA
jgi:hypothetical protein